MPLTTDPASPPQTPIKVTQAGYRKQSRNRPGKKNRTTRPRPTLVQQSADTNGQQQQSSKIAKNVPFRPNPFRPDELSPRSSDSSGMMEDYRIHDDDAGGKGDNDSDSNNGDEDVDDDDDDDDDDDGVALQFESDPCSSSGGSLPRVACPVGISRLQASPRNTPLQRPSEHGSGSASPTSPYASDEEAKNVASEAENSSVASSPLAIEATVVIEELFDFDSDGGRIEVLLPDSIEEPESEHEASPTASATNPHRRGTLHFGKGRRRLSSMRSARPPDIDRSVMSGLRGFSFRTVSDEEVVLDDNDEDEDNSDFDEESYNQFRLKQREERRRRRMTSGSIGKRTITESIGSDTDNEDLRSQLDISEVGSSARRLRRRIGDRTSLQFSDPPPPRIDELDEPDTTTDNDDDDDEDDIRELIEDGESLARELPYYTLEFISMEVDSP